MPDRLILVLAKEYGRAPEEVEKWDEYWFERAVTLLVAENILAERRQKEFEKRARR